jgi:hypothetical protein
MDQNQFPWVSLLTGGGLMMLGSLIATLVTIVNDQKKRVWQITDDEKEKRIKVRNMRLDQVEDFINTFVDDLYAADVQFQKLTEEMIHQDELIEDAYHVIGTRQNHDADSLIGTRLDHKMKRYKLGPIYMSIIDKSLNQYINRLFFLFAKLRDLYDDTFTYYRNFEQSDVEVLCHEWDGFQVKVNDCLTKIYREIERLRTIDPIIN